MWPYAVSGSFVIQSLKYSKLGSEEIIKTLWIMRWIPKSPPMNIGGLLLNMLAKSQVARSYINKLYLLVRDTEFDK